jgi:Tol biopolymer transport system component
MGMFDTFLTNNKFTCSNCNTNIQFIQGIQSKKFECELSIFKPGDIPFGLNDNRQVVQDHDWCPKCSKIIPVFFSFHSGIYVEAFSSSALAVQASSNFDIRNAYKSMCNERNKMTEKANGLLSALTYVYDLHSKNSSKPRLTPYFSLRLNNIIDYNIITTIKNILDKYK